MSIEAINAIQEYLWRRDGRAPSVAEIKRRIAEFVERRDAVRPMPKRGRYSWNPDREFYVIREGKLIERIKIKE